MYEFWPRHADESGHHPTLGQREMGWIRVRHSTMTLGSAGEYGSRWRETPDPHRYSAQLPSGSPSVGLCTGLGRDTPMEVSTIRHSMNERRDG